MNQRALAEVILKILGVKCIYDFILQLNVSGVYMQFWGSHQASGKGMPDVFLTSILFFLLQLVFGVVLILAATPIARTLFRSDLVAFEPSAQFAQAVSRASVPLIGLFLFVVNLPMFFTTAYSWIREEIHETHITQSVYGPSMIQYTLTIGLAAILMFKSDWLFKKRMHDE